MKTRTFLLFTIVVPLFLSNLSAQEYTIATPAQRVSLEEALHESQINNGRNSRLDSSHFTYERGELLDAAVWHHNGKEYATILSLDTLIMGGNYLKDTVREKTGDSYHLFTNEGDSIKVLVLDGEKNIIREVARWSYYAEKYPNKWIVYKKADFLGSDPDLRSKARAIAKKLRER